MDKTVEDYVSAELKKGIQASKIKEALILVGHDIELVEKKIKGEEEKLLEQNISIDKDLDSDLLKYIEHSIDHGRGLEEIKDELLKAGHHPIKVDKHLKHITGKKKKNKGSGHTGTFKLGLITVLLTGFIIVVLFYVVGGNQGVLIDDERPPELQDASAAVGDINPQEEDESLTEQSITAGTEDAPVVGQSTTEGAEEGASTEQPTLEGGDEPVVGQPSEEAVCGDGVCQDDELQNQNCLQDCGEELRIGEGSTAVCGDGRCNGYEFINKDCPQDCE